MGNGTLVDSMINDGLWDPYKDSHMGNCAELVRREVRVHPRGAGRLRPRVLPPRAGGGEDGARRRGDRARRRSRSKKGDPEVVDTDEEPFAAPLEKMATLKPAFREGRHGHGRQLVEDQRRRGGARRHVATRPRRERPEADRADHRVHGGRAGARVVHDRADRRDRQALARRRASPPPTSTSSRSTRRSRRSRWRRSTSSTSTRRRSTCAAARSPSATRSAPPARAS